MQGSRLCRTRVKEYGATWFEVMKLSATLDVFDDLAGDTSRAITNHNSYSTQWRKYSSVFSDLLMADG
jgi:hypothetical protein